MGTKARWWIAALIAAAVCGTGIERLPQIRGHTLGPGRLEGDLSRAELLEQVKTDLRGVHARVPLHTDVNLVLDPAYQRSEAQQGLYELLSAYVCAPVRVNRQPVAGRPLLLYAATESSLSEAIHLMGGSRHLPVSEVAAVIEPPR